MRSKLQHQAADHTRLWRRRSTRRNAKGCFSPVRDVNYSLLSQPIALWGGSLSRENYSHTGALSRTRRDFEFRLGIFAKGADEQRAELAPFGPFNTLGQAHPIVRDCDAT